MWKKMNFTKKSEIVIAKYFNFDNLKGIFVLCKDTIISILNHFRPVFIWETVLSQFTYFFSQICGKSNSFWLEKFKNFAEKVCDYFYLAFNNFKMILNPIPSNYIIIESFSPYYQKCIIKYVLFLWFLDQRILYFDNLNVFQAWKAVISKKYVSNNT